MTAPILRICPPQPAPAPARIRQDAWDYPEPCADNLRLRQDYMDALSAFNAAAVVHNLVLKTGLQGAAFEASWRKLRDRAAESRSAWSRYRKHVATHSCRRA